MKYWIWGLCTLAALAGCDDDDAAAAMGDGDAEVRGLQTGSTGRDMSVSTRPGAPTTIGVDAAVEMPANTGGSTTASDGTTMGGSAATEAGCSPDIACATEGVSECFGGDTVRTCERNADTGCIEWSALPSVPWVNAVSARPAPLIIPTNSPRAATICVARVKVSARRTAKYSSAVVTKMGVMYGPMHGPAQMALRVSTGSAPSALVRVPITPMPVFKSTPCNA